MKETAEFRIRERFAGRLFADNEGEKLWPAGVPFIRKVKLDTSDLRFNRVGELQREIRAVDAGDGFFSGWDLRRRYTKKELAAAASFQLIISTTFEPAGELCGTVYDDSTGCPICGTGAKQVGDLWLDLRKAPKRKDFARTIADEWIVSQRLAEKMIEAGLTGFELRPVRHKARFEDDPVDLLKVPSGLELRQKAAAAGIIPDHTSWKFTVWINRSDNSPLFDEAVKEHAALREDLSKRVGKPIPVWHQLIVTTADAEIIPPTCSGINPFDGDPDGKCRCPLGDLMGLNLLSEVSISTQSRGDDDLVCSRQFFGARRGVLRPHRLILISQKFRKLIEDENVRGAYIEVAHLL